MRSWLVGLCVLLSPSAFAQSTSAPELQFDSVPNFIKLPPDMHLGEASGVAVNSKGNIMVYSRGGTVANAFGATSIGHFPTYRYEELKVSNKDIGKVFNQVLRSFGYRALKTTLWNNRPAIWTNQEIG